MPDTPPRMHEPRQITRWIRGAALVGAIGAMLGFLGDLYHIYWAFFTDLERSELLGDVLYRAHGILISAGYAAALLLLPALAVRLRRHMRGIGTVGIMLAFVGTTMVAGDYWAESAVTPGVVASQPALADEDVSGTHLILVVVGFGLHAIGWLLATIGAWKGLPRATAIALAVGSVLAFTPLPGSNIVLFTAAAALALWLRRPLPRRLYNNAAVAAPTPA